MKLSSFKIWLCLAVLSFAWSGCDKENEPETRNFYMGFTPFPYDNSLEAINYSYNKLATEADIINHHFDNGVPWDAALNEAPFHQNIMDDWTFRKNNTGENHKVYVSVTPLNFLRNGLASYRGETDNMELPAPWDSYPFNHVNVRTAYFNYCKRIIDFFEPDYFNMAIEANLLYVNNPSKWSEYILMHQYVFSQLKSAFPDLPIFTSVAGAYLLPGFFDGNDHVQQRLAVMQLLDYSDYYGISFYAYLTNYLGNRYPDNTFPELFSISTKPLVVAETGYAAQTFSMDAGAGQVTIESDPTKQQRYIDDLLYYAERHKALFVINFLIRDYDQLWQQIGSPTDLTIAWKDSGFYDENGEPRPALNSWKSFLSRKYKQPN